MTEHRRGVVYALIAYVSWGVLPLYIRSLRAVPPLEIVAHRIAWASLFLVAIVAGTRQLGWLRELRERPRTLLTFIGSALMLSVNWLVFMWAVAQGRVVDASLGYFINPLFSVVLAVVVLKERLRRVQWLAVAIALLGVVWLTLLAHQLPWIGLSVAFSFGVYGLLRKTARLDALGGLTLETLLLVPLAASYLWWLAAHDTGAWSTSSSRQSTLLVLAGPITALPLLSFAAGARRIPLSLVGILQYVGPTLQLGIGVLVFHEALAPAKWVGFALIWLALLVYAVDALRHRA